MIELWNWISTFFMGIGDIWSWLIKPIEELGDWTPISIIGIGGLTTILILWIVKLVLPF